MESEEMSPLQVARINFWLPIVAAMASFTLAAGMAWGVTVTSIARNSNDIIELQESGTTITAILVAQEGAKVEREGLKEGLEAIRRILERRWDLPTGE